MMWFTIEIFFPLKKRGFLLLGKKRLTDYYYELEGNDADE